MRKLLTKSSLIFESGAVQKCVNLVVLIKSFQTIISIYFQKFPEPLSLTDIAAKVGTSYEYVRRICTEMFELGLLSRTKVENGNKGRPSYLYGPA